MRFLGNREKKKLIEKLPKGYSISKKDEIKQKDEILYKNGEKFLIKINEKYYPHINSIPKNKYKSVHIDRGAIPFIIKGADLMRPGISKIDPEIKKDDIIMILDEEHKKLLALGIALYEFNEMKIQQKGKSIKIFHYFNDKYYN